MTSATREVRWKVVVFPVGMPVGWVRWGPPHRGGVIGSGSGTVAVAGECREVECGGYFGFQESVFACAADELDLTAADLVVRRDLVEGEVPGSQVGPGGLPAAVGGGVDGDAAHEVHREVTVAGLRSQPGAGVGVAAG
jgi:hypothetical protein